MKKKCVYCIRNLVNNKIYIGSTVRYSIRKKDHISALKRGSHKNKELQADFNKYKLSSFQFVVLLEVENEEDLRDYEDWYIKNFSDDLYNNSDSTDSPISFSLSKEAKKKISKSKLGERNPKSRISCEEALQIKSMIKEEIPISKIAELMNCSTGLVYGIRDGRTWRHVS